MGDSEGRTPPFDRIAAYYDGLVRKYGLDPRACDYGHPGSQTAKFRVLADVAPMAGRSVLDVGCGFADYCDYLEQRYGTVRYTGIDLTPAMISAARRRRAGLDVRVANLLEIEGESRFDVVSANGIFYLLGAGAEEMMRRMIAQMFRLARIAVAVNSLSSCAPDPEPGEFYADPMATAAWCRTLTPWVTLRHDYHPRDFTLYLYKSRPS